MKIIMVAIPNHHFFKWVLHLEHSGYEVHWFDITDGGPKSSKINWVTQHKGWKLKWDFPFRVSLKKNFYSLYRCIQRFNEYDVNTAFEKLIVSIQPDVIHCFEMKLSGLPILKTLMKYPNIPLIYSSWGSDIFYFNELGTPTGKVNSFLKRSNHLITDCKRDIKIAKKNGFDKTVLGVFPGNGGLDIKNVSQTPIPKRKHIIFKGYQYDVGEAIQILKAIELLPSLIQSKYNFIVYSADEEIGTYIKNSKKLNQLNFKILFRDIKIPNEELIALMGESIIHIGNNVSDGMPNTMLEAMMQGCFPIQSNPGNATAEVITHGVNGYLIEDPFDYVSISHLIETALLNEQLRLSASEINLKIIKEQYNRDILKPEIVNLYPLTHAN